MKHMLILSLLLAFAGLGYGQGSSEGSDGQAPSHEHDHDHDEAATPGSAAGLPGVQGNFADLDLSEHKGKVVVLVSLAGWCVGCFPEVPNFVQLHQDYADEDVVVIGVMTQSAPEWTETFVERFGVTYPIYLDMPGRAVGERFGPQVVPTGMIVYDREGNQVEAMGGFDAARLRPVIDSLL